MSFSLITEAHAAAAPAAGAAAPGSQFLSFLPLLLLFGVFYFMLIRPQMKRQKEVRNMLSQLAKNDEVIAAGIAGRVDEVGESFCTVEIAPNVKIRVQKGAITQVLPKGTLKSS
jgi:preprotein translocase subunit YajC